MSIHRQASLRTTYSFEPIAVIRRILILALLTVLAPTCASAGYPLLSKFTRQANGPYAPSTGRYVVVDPVPAGVAGFDQHGHATSAAPGELWQRRELDRPTYPYGWFGAAPHATRSWSHTGYYDNYTDHRYLRGR